MKNETGMFFVFSEIDPTVAVLFPFARRLKSGRVKSPYGDF